MFFEAEGLPVERAIDLFSLAYDDERFVCEAGILVACRGRVAVEVCVEHVADRAEAEAAVWTTGACTGWGRSRCFLLGVSDPPLRAYL